MTIVDFSKPSIGGGINLKGSIETDNSEVTLYEYNSNKKINQIKSNNYNY